jgi:pimeloyl-ACP methyl ester carboxylesterase
MHHLHRAFRGETRSILIDRPGTGWSDTGPFPRTTAREAEEVVLALERAGERGPFIWAGHSFGGCWQPTSRGAGPTWCTLLVLLDPTPLETIVFGPRLGALKDDAPQRLAGRLGAAVRRSTCVAGRGARPGRTRPMPR